MITKVDAKNTSFFFAIFAILSEFFAVKKNR
jgi:hypothetical protein